MPPAAHLESIGRAVQGEIYRRGALGRRPAIPVGSDALERAARRRMSAAAWAYVAGSAGRFDTAAANRAAFNAWEIVPRVLRDISTRDMGIELFGRRLPTPLLLAPLGALDLVRREADLQIAAAAASLDVPMLISSQGSAPMERTAAALGSAPRWFQLYWSSSDELTESFVRRAEKTGAEAIVVTLDTQMLGWRTADLELGSLPFVRGLGIAQYTSDPVFAELVRERAAKTGERRAGQRTRPAPGAVRTLLTLARSHPGPILANLRSPLPRAAVETFLELFSRPSLTWTDLAWLRQRTRLPILLKGILDPRDAALAVEHGVDGIIVSNHGGRQIDGEVAALSVLPEVVAAVGERLPVLFDSGIRGGADVFKALALGARAVGIGRPVAYGLAMSGSAGVIGVLRHLLAELDITMTLSGCCSVDEIASHLLRPASR
ncbi:MAG TPA: alpha-hydroxy-acid oxidizing protein [Candidatus Limnocylindria bacterium]|nr:alpha-hydroxy-acid oxidizing protein [Candidatus Limnocylindria bacterium]